MKKNVLICIIFGMLIFTGCGKTDGLAGKWEGVNTTADIEFIDGNTLKWGGDIFDYERKDDNLIIDFNIFKESYPYVLDNGVLVLGDEGSDEKIFVTESYFDNNEDLLKKLTGEWGTGLNAEYSFSENGEMFIMNLPDAETYDIGEYFIGNSIIKFVSGTDPDQEYYLEYELDGQNLLLNFIGSEQVELKRVDTEDLKRKAQEDYDSRYESGKLNQYEIDAMGSDERPEYIDGHVLRYLKKEMVNSIKGIPSAKDIAIGVKNMSSRTIDYITYEVSYKNKVGDSIENDGLTSFYLKFTGPVEQNESAGIDTYWASVTFNKQVVDWAIENIAIEYSEGNVIELDDAEIRLVGKADENKNVESKRELEGGNQTSEAATCLTAGIQSIDNIFTSTYDELIAYYGDNYDAFDYGGSKMIDYRGAGSDIMIGFSNNSFNSTSTPSTAYLYYIDWIGAYFGIEGDVTPESVINVLGAPNYAGYDEMGELGYLMEYVDGPWHYIWISNDENSVVTVMQVVLE